MRDSYRTLAVLTAAWLVLGCARERPPERAESPAEVREAPREELAPEPSHAADDVPNQEAAYRERYDQITARRTQRGQAAYYGDSLAGHRTANGERYDPQAFTAAHRSFPFDTIVRVVCRKTGKHTYVRITDRGPFGNSKRVIDLSRIAAERLGIIGQGVADVRLEVVQWGHKKH